jgi:trehalose 6-phosphate synthase
MFRYVVLRFVPALAVAAALVAWFGMPYFDGLLTAWSRVHAENRALAVMNGVERPLSGLVDGGESAPIQSQLSHMLSDSRIEAIALCRPDGTTIARTIGGSSAVACASDDATGSADAGRIVQEPSGSALIVRYQSNLPGHTPFRLVIEHRLLAAGLDQAGLRNFVLAFAVVATLILALLVALVAWWLLRSWVAVLVSDIRSGRFFDDAWSPRFSLPILSQLRKVLSEVEETQRREIDYRENWTPQALRQVVVEHLQSEQIIVVSNRQPYSHIQDADGSVRVQLPASGMVTALEPVMRACSGVWIAHGSGSADRQVVDRSDRVRVPPQEPAYTLRRVWLSKEEENAYYYGFSNEGLWPLCHLAYVRPAFRLNDWLTYQAVNAKFADVVARESTSRSPLVLIQDFHFALLPQLVRKRIPKATIVLFWHVPWPNPETFGVCPWKRDILMHMLHADILGFHTQYHCQNFLATADRFIECQISHEHMTVTLQGHVCHVTPYPISIEWPPRWLTQAPDIPTARAEVRRSYDIGEGERLVLGVERWDFTKGIVERFHALELLLEQRPALLGHITLLQIAAPSRSELPAYQELQRHTLAEAARVNTRFAAGTWKPIVMIGEHQEPETVFKLYRAADICLVNSLHDGMNLVAKEFVAARDDEDGVLILSTFAGASQELVEALPVNPFDVAETAAAIAAAVDMPRDERRERMRLMRRTVKDNNVYRWAGRMLTDAARIRQRQSLHIGRA